MTTYSINIDYTTGDSERSERIFQEVGMNWENINQAKKALWAISDHHKAHEYYEDLVDYERSDFEKSIRSKPWYAGPIEGTKGWNGVWLRQVVVEKDDGSKFAIDAFWHGCFERLHMAEVCIAACSKEKSDDRRIYF